MATTSTTAVDAGTKKKSSGALELIIPPSQVEAIKLAHDEHGSALFQCGKPGFTPVFHALACAAVLNVEEGSTTTSMGLWRRTGECFLEAAQDLCNESNIFSPALLNLPAIASCINPNKLVIGAGCGGLFALTVPYEGGDTLNKTRTDQTVHQTGKSGIAKIKQVLAEYSSLLVGGILPSGETHETILLKTRQLIFKKQQKEEDDKVENEEDSMPSTFFPPGWLPFLLLGPYRSAADLEVMPGLTLYNCKETDASSMSRKERRQAEMGARNGTTRATAAAERMATASEGATANSGVVAKSSRVSSAALKSLAKTEQERLAMQKRTEAIDAMRILIATQYQMLPMFTVGSAEHAAQLQEVLALTQELKELVKKQTSSESIRHEENVESAEESAEENIEESVNSSSFASSPPALLARTHIASSSDNYDMIVMSSGGGQPKVKRKRATKAEMEQRRANQAKRVNTDQNEPPTFAMV